MILRIHDNTSQFCFSLKFWKVPTTASTALSDWIIQWRAHMHMSAFIEKFRVMSQALFHPVYLYMSFFFPSGSYVESIGSTSALKLHHITLQLSGKWQQIQIS